jgi:hypothetical protein
MKRKGNMEEKIICQLCKREFKNLLALKVHLARSHKHQSSEEYYDLYLSNGKSNVCICGEKRKFYNISKGYMLSCGSNKCATKINFQKLRDLGEDEYKKEIDKRTAKSQEKSFEKYGCASYTQTEEYIEKTKKKHLEKCGYEWSTQSPKHKESVKKTSQKNYGVDHHLKAPEVKETRRQTNQRERGVDNVFQDESIKATIKETWEKNYPEGHPNRNKEVRNRIEETTLKNHGVRQFLSLNPGKDKAKRTALNTNLKIILKRLEGKYIPLFEPVEYEGTSLIYKWKCIKCGKEFEDYVYNSHPRCPDCFPGKFGGSSFAEKEVAYFIENYVEILTNKKFTIENSEKKFEIDIFVPSLNIGIEYNGTRWHAEDFGNKDKSYHIMKTEECLKQEIQLIHVFEHEWLYNQDKIKSMLLSKIGYSPIKIQARKCVIKEIPSNESNEFLVNNHLQNAVQSSIRIGLCYNDEIVSIMTFGKSRFNKNYDYELLRFCNKLNTTVIGGFAKLLNYFRNNYKGTLISYADRRFSNGNIYEKNGFNLIHISPPNYYYISPKLTIHNRIQFQKHKLKEALPIFDENLSEWENMKLNKYDRFWDCGNLVYELK